VPEESPTKTLGEWDTKERRGNPQNSPTLSGRHSRRGTSGRGEKKTYSEQIGGCLSNFVTEALGTRCKGEFGEVSNQRTNELDLHLLGGHFSKMGEEQEESKCFCKCPTVSVLTHYKLRKREKEKEGEGGP